jgi:hypothetical protein
MPATISAAIATATLAPAIAVERQGGDRFRGARRLCRSTLTAIYSRSRCI